MWRSPFALLVGLSRAAVLVGHASRWQIAPYAPGEEREGIAVMAAWEVTAGPSDPMRSSPSTARARSLREDDRIPDSFPGLHRGFFCIAEFKTVFWDRMDGPTHKTNPHPKIVLEIHLRCCAHSWSVTQPCSCPRRRSTTPRPWSRRGRSACSYFFNKVKGGTESMAVNVLAVNRLFLSPPPST